MELTDNLRRTQTPPARGPDSTQALDRDALQGTPDGAAFGGERPGAQAPGGRDASQVPADDAAPTPGCFHSRPGCFHYEDTYGRAAGIPSLGLVRAPRRPVDRKMFYLHVALMVFEVGVAAYLLSTLIMYGGSSFTWAYKLTFIIPAFLGLLACVKTAITKSGNERIRSLDGIIGLTCIAIAFHLAIMSCIAGSIVAVCAGTLAGPWLALTIPAGLFIAVMIIREMCKAAGSR